MENSFINDSIFNIMKNKVYEAYDNAKTRIEQQSLTIMKIINQIKSENEVFYSKCIDIINSTEKDQNSVVCSPNETNQKLKYRNKQSQQLKFKMSPISKQYSNSLSKTKNGKQTKLNPSTPTHYLPSSKTTTSTELSKHWKIEKPQIAFNVNKIKKQELKPNYHLNHNVLSSNKNSSQYLTQNSTNANSSSANVNVNVSAFHIKNSITKNEIELTDMTRDENRKNTTNETRKFSIIDIPCLNIEEVSNHIKKSTITSKATPKSKRNPNLKYAKRLQASYIKHNNCHNDKTNQQSLESNMSQLCYIMAKEKIVPLKLRLTFGSFDRTVYMFYPPSDIIQSYSSIIKNRLSRFETNEELVPSFTPSLTALSSLYFVNEKQEKMFIDALASQMFSEDQITLIVPIVKLLSLLFQIDCSALNDNSLISSLVQLTQTQSIKQHLLSTNISNISDDVMERYIDIIEQSPDIFHIKQLEKTDAILPKLCFFLDEVYNYFCYKRSFVQKRDNYVKEKKLFEERLLYSKMQS